MIVISSIAITIRSYYIAITYLFPLPVVDRKLSHIKFGLRQNHHIP